jgi:hypothetical protein
MRAGSEHAFAAVMNGRKRREVPLAEGASEFVCELRCGNRNKFWVIAEDLREEGV